MDENDLLRFRAEDFEHNFFSLRDTEWKVVFQLFAGYALVGAAAYSLGNDLPQKHWLGAGLAAGTWVIFAATAFLTYQLQTRLHFTRNMQNEYIGALHRSLDVQQLETTARQPRFQRWFAFVVQMVLAFVFMAGLILYIASLTFTEILH